MDKKWKLLIGGFLFAVALIAAGWGYRTISNRMSAGAAQEQAQPKQVQPPEPAPAEQDPERIAAPDFSVEDAEGNTVKLSDYLGTPVVINFWTSWCPPCKEELPYFNDAAAAYGDSVVFMMVDLADGNRETVEIAKEYIASQGYTFPVYFDTASEAAYQYAVRSIPATYFVDAGGAIMSYHIGVIDADRLQSEIERLLRSSEGPGA